MRHQNKVYITKIEGKQNTKHIEIMEAASEAAICMAASADKLHIPTKISLASKTIATIQNPSISIRNITVCFAEKVPFSSYSFS